MSIRQPIISIPLRYNLELYAQDGRPLSPHFNSTKVQFGDTDHQIRADSLCHFNSTKVQFGVAQNGLSPVGLSISIPLRYNLEELMLRLMSIDLHFNSTKVQFGVRRILNCPPGGCLISIPLRYNLEIS